MNGNFNIFISLLAFSINHFQCQLLGTHEVEFRSLDGRGNNVFNPYWGSAPRTNNFLNSPNYGDGKICPRLAVPGTSTLPLARNVSYNIMYIPDKKDDYNNLTMVHVYFGMLLTHDLVLTILDNTPSIAYPCALPSPKCSISQIYIGVNDPYFKNTACLTLGVNNGLFCEKSNQRLCGCTKCIDGQFQSLNHMTSYIDLSDIYPVDQNVLASFREPQSARMILTKDNLVPLAPNTNTTSVPCLQANNKTAGPCLQISEKSANLAENLQALSTIVIREHNRIADNMRKIFPDLDRAFNESRKLNIAEFQQIVYNEYLPSIFGDCLCADLKVPTKNYKYNQNLDATLTTEFIASAFRFGHSQPKNFNSLGNKPDVTSIGQTFSVVTYMTNGVNVVDKMISGMLTDRTKETDVRYVEQFVNHIRFGNITQTNDLAAIDIERGRLFGVMSYTKARQYLKLWVPKTYVDLAKLMPAKIVSKMKTYYGPDGINNIDLILGGLAEYKNKNCRGILFGDTFRYIIADQFRRLKFGDRFWFENSFTTAQLKEIRKTTLSSVICRNTDLNMINKCAFKASSPVLSCEKIIQDAEIDYSFW